MSWHTECTEAQPRRIHDALKFQKEQVEPMSVVANNSTVHSVPGFPGGVNVRRETQRRLVWNVREHASEERELVYEIRWIAGLGLWRSFLRSQRNLNR